MCLMVERAPRQHVQAQPLSFRVAAPVIATHEDPCGPKTGAGGLRLRLKRRPKMYLSGVQLPLVTRNPPEPASRGQYLVRGDRVPQQLSEGQHGCAVLLAV